MNKNINCPECGGLMEWLDDMAKYGGKDGYRCEDCPRVVYHKCNCSPLTCYTFCGCACHKKKEVV